MQSYAFVLLRYANLHPGRKKTSSEIVACLIHWGNLPNQVRTMRESDARDSLKAFGKACFWVSVVRFGLENAGMQARYCQRKRLAALGRYQPQGSHSLESR